MVYMSLWLELLISKVLSRFLLRVPGKVQQSIHRYSELEDKQR